MLMSCLYFFSCELALLSLAHFSTEVLGVLTDWWESFPLQVFFFLDFKGNSEHTFWTHYVQLINYCWEELSSRVIMSFFGAVPVSDIETSLQVDNIL